VGGRDSADAGRYILAHRFSRPCQKPLKKKIRNFWGSALPEARHFECWNLHALPAGLAVAQPGVDIAKSPLAPMISSPESSLAACLCKVI